MSDDERRADGGLIAIIVALVLLLLLGVVGGGLLFHRYARVHQELLMMHQAERQARDQAMQAAEEARANLGKAMQAEKEVAEVLKDHSTTFKEPPEPKSDPPRDDN